VGLNRYLAPGAECPDWALAQAEGMISAQANVPIAEALMVLDDYANWNGQSRHEVAQRVLERHLRFDNRSGLPRRVK
jgi:hypothetical protein